MHVSAAAVTAVGDTAASCLPSQFLLIDCLAVFALVLLDAALVFSGSNSSGGGSSRGSRGRSSSSNNNNSSRCCYSCSCFYCLAAAAADVAAADVRLMRQSQSHQHQDDSV